MQILLVVIFIAFVVLGVPISFALGFVSFAGIAALPIIPNSVVFTKMFNGLNSFTLLAVPLFILAANLMNEGAISDRLIDVCSACVGHVRGGLAQHPCVHDFCGHIRLLTGRYGRRGKNPDSGHGKAGI